jgi:2'-5' RNA ligase
MAKAAIVLLVDPTVHNFMRRLSLRLYNEFGLGFRAARLPPHITLKQPFHTSRLPPLERYFDGLAAELEPIPITLERLEFKTGEVMGEEVGLLASSGRRTG